MTAEFLLLLAIGFFAQMIDGALGMAFGVVSATAMLAIGLPPAQASALVHTAEIFTTGASAASHIHNRNVDWRIVRRLGIAGVLGAILGAWILSNVDSTAMRALVSGYLFFMGLYIILRAVHMMPTRDAPAKWMPPVGFAAGFLDASGGGGWGPVVTSNLLIQGATPRHTIGTVNTAEFFLTATASVTFFSVLGWSAFTLHTLGILVGGIVAAPFGGILAKRVPTRHLMALVGVLLTLTSAWSIYSALAK